MNNSSFSYIANQIENDIDSLLKSIGIHYRLHSRVKENDSLAKKIASKGKGYYSPSGKKVQDIIGLRITTYFYDDVQILWDIFSKLFVVDQVYDQEEATIFKPLRKNMVCKIPIRYLKVFQEASSIDPTFQLLDSTFELQFRTTLSEGWHEIDHELRYKCHDDWKSYNEEERLFNGIFATLESNDRMLKTLFDELAYNHYKKKNWEALFRTKFRLHFHTTPLAPQIKDFLDSNNDFAKIILRFNRRSLLKMIAINELSIPLKYDNLFWLIVFLEAAPNAKIRKSIPQIFLEEWNKKLTQE